MERNAALKSSAMILGLLIAAVAAAQMVHHGGEFMQAMEASMKKMDRDMAAAPMNGDVDHDFATMMMPHHQGAIDMAKVELRYGKDPVMRRLAQEILVDQQSEIDAMQLWLTKKTPDNVKKDR
jgi:uncharacterized protein (DUF305 family)